MVGRQAASKELQYLHDINTVFVRQLCASAESSGLCPPRIAAAAHLLASVTPCRLFQVWFSKRMSLEQKTRITSHSARLHRLAPTSHFTPVA